MDALSGGSLSREVSDKGTPSLFTFSSSTQSLSATLNYKTTHRNLRGIRIARGIPMITRLFFADESLVFFKANRQNCNLIQDSLNVYEKASEHQINYDKSTIIFSKETPKNHIHYI